MLTVVQIRALRPAERPYKVADSDGLYYVTALVKIDTNCSSKSGSG